MICPNCKSNLDEVIGVVEGWRSCSLNKNDCICEYGSIEDAVIYRYECPECYEGISGVVNKAQELE